MPSSVVKMATTTLFRTQRPKGWSVITDVKLVVDHCWGQGITARSRCRKDGSDGTSAMASVCRPEKAMLITQRTG